MGTDRALPRGATAPHTPDKCEALGSGVRPGYPQEPPQLVYQLPNGFCIRLQYDLCRARGLVDFQLKDGSIVLARLVSRHQDVTAAYRAWRNDE